MEIQDLTLRRFATKLKTEILPHLDKRQKDENALLSMGVAALFLSAEAGMPLTQSALYIVDGEGDLGIDGIWLDSRSNVLHIVSAKFRQNQKKSFDQGEVLKFQNGVERLIKGQMDDAGRKLKAAYKRIESALSDINTKIQLSLLSTGKSNLEPNCKQIIDRYCAEKNDVDEVFEAKFVRFEELYRLARMFSPDATTDVSVSISGIGTISKPFYSYFGHVAGQHIAEWVKKYGLSLFSQNVRFTLSKSEVNDQIFATIWETPKLFWYFNNGITAIAAEAKKAPAGGEEAIVQCNSLSIVNGAQTAGMLARAAEAGIDLSEIRVPFRVISLVGSDPGFDEEVTRANNTQNELNALDFVSLDVKQELLKNEIMTLGYQYIIKRGANVENDTDQIEIKDAAVALACSCNDVAIAVQAKRYVSALWRNIETKPYTEIFRDDLTGEELVKTVTTMRKIEELIRFLKQGASKEDAQILTHGDKFIAHVAFRIADRKKYNLPDELSETEILEICRRVTRAFFVKYPGGYPPTVFKNVGAQEAMRDSILADLLDGEDVQDQQF